MNRLEAGSLEFAQRHDAAQLQIAAQAQREGWEVLRRGPYSIAGRSFVTVRIPEHWGELEAWRGKDRGYRPDCCKNML